MQSIAKDIDNFVKKSDKKVAYKFVDFTNAWSKSKQLLDEFYQ